MADSDEEVAMMVRWTEQVMAGLLACLLALAAGVLGPVAPAAAASGDQLFWVGSTTSPAVTDGLFGATAATVSSGAANLDSQTGLYRTLATDGTYLYFNSGGNLVRTALNGTGMTTVVAGVSSAEQIAFAGGYVYYTTYSGGVYGASLASLPATASQIFTAPGSGWNGVAISGNTIFATYNNGSGTQGNQGLWAATLNGTSAVTATMIDADAVMTYRAAKIAAAGGNLYMAGSSGSIPVRNISTGAWTSINVSAATGQSVYSVAPLGSTLYFSTSGGLIGSVTTGGTGATALTSVGQFSSAWSVTAAAPSGTPYYAVTYDANNATSGAVPTDYNSPYAAGSTATVLANTGSLARTGYLFRRWNTAANGGGTSRTPGSTFTINADTTLHAQWTGGPLEFSETLSPWTPVSTVAFPDTTQGVASSATVYVKNTATSGSVTVGSITDTSSAVSVSGCPNSAAIAPGGICTLTLNWNPPNTTPLSASVSLFDSPLTYTLALTGTVTQPARTPTFSSPVPTAAGFTVNVTNYDANWTWTPSVDSGSVAAGTASGSTLPLTVSGLAPGASATVTVDTTRTGYVNGSATVAGAALFIARTPTFSSPVSTADGFTVNVTNYDDSWVWAMFVSAGTVTAGTAVGSTLPLTVTGLATGGSAMVTVDATRASYADGTASVTGSASNPTPAPVRAPGPPVSVWVTPKDASIAVGWRPPVDEGSFPVTTYRAQASPGGASCLASAPTLTCRIAGLNNGTPYSVSVQALNGAGWSPWSAPAGPVTPSPKPSPPIPSPVPAPPLAPGESDLNVDGQRQPVEVNPNRQGDGLDVAGLSWTMTLQALDGDYQPIGLGPNGILIVDAERDVHTTGTAFRPGSYVTLFLDPPATQTPHSEFASNTIVLGAVAVNADGTFAGTRTLPDGIDPGAHVLQAVGFGDDGSERAMSIGILVQAWITLDQGTRVMDQRHDRVRAGGDTGGIDAGARLTPWIRYSSKDSFRPGSARIKISSDGSFTWTRLIRKDRGLTAYMAYQDLESNRVFWAKVRQR